MGGSDVLERLRSRALGPLSVALSLTGAAACGITLAGFIFAAPAALTGIAAGLTLGHLSLLRDFRGQMRHRVLGAVGLSIGYLAVAASIVIAASATMFLWMIAFAPQR